MAALERLELCHEGIDIAELAIHRCKAHVCYLVALAQQIHHHFAKLLRGDLLAQGVLQILLDKIDDLLSVYRALLRCLKHTDKQLGLIKELLFPILLDHENLYRFHDLKRGKALLALQAFASAANTATVIDRSGVNYLTLCKSTCGTIHISSKPPSKNHLCDNYITHFCICKGLTTTYCVIFTDFS